MYIVSRYVLSLGSWLPAIPQQRLELQAHKAGASPALLRFGVSLFGSVLAGLLVRHIQSPSGRHLFSGTSGLLLLYLSLGGHIIHSLTVSLAVYGLMRLAPAKCGAPAWVICFTYLTALHMARLGSGNYTAGALNFITGAQMVLTLKLISMAMCLQDGHTKTAKELTPYQASHCFKQLPGPLEYLGYVYCLGSLGVGPLIEFRDYQQWAAQQGTWQPSTSRKASRGNLAVGFTSLLVGLLSVAFFLHMDKQWSPRLLTTPWYAALPLSRKLLVMQLVGVTFRARYYFIWSISRAAMALAGLDLIKWDEQQQAGSWGRCCNAHPLAVELADSGRLMGNNWNITTSVFMRRYVYERLGRPGGQPGAAALLATLFVSSFWHGLAVGYYMFFMGWAVFMTHSTVLHKAEKAYLPGWLCSSWPWWLIKVAITQQCSVFLLQAFALSTWRECMGAWSNVYYLPLAYMATVLLLGKFVLGKFPKPGVLQREASSSSDRSRGSQCKAGQQQQQQQRAVQQGSSSTVPGAQCDQAVVNGFHKKDA